jgi:hypothetical protein
MAPVYTGVHSLDSGGIRRDFRQPVYGCSGRQDSPDSGEDENSLARVQFPYGT